VKRGNLVWSCPANEAPCYMRRCGRESAGLLEHYRRITTEDFMKIYADIGITNIYPYFFKGFGLKIERRHFPSLKKIIDNAHKYGITVAPYAQFNSIMYEAILDEVPEAKEWRRVSNAGISATYGEQDFRWKPCPSHRGFVNYLKKVIHACIVELGCDGIFFDNFGYIGDVVKECEWWEGCHCENCQKGFKEFLRRKYPDPYPYFGIPNFDNVEIPDSHLRQEDPLVREYWYFFNDLLKNTLTELYSYMKSLKPDAALGTNSAALPFTNPYAFKGVSDMVCWEDMSYPRVEDGCLISQIHQCKTASAAGANIVKLGGSRRHPDKGRTRRIDPRLGMAEGMAYGSHTPQMGFAVPHRKSQELPPAYRIAKDYVGFFRKNKKIYLEPENAATVAILYCYDSFVRDFRHAYACLKGIEHTCLLNHIPFDLIYTENLCEADFIRKRLPQYDVLALTDAKYLPEKAVSTIRDFVRAGGGLYASGETSLYDSVFRQQANYGLADVLGISNRGGAKGKISIRFNYFGKGRAAYTAAIPEKALFLDEEGNPPKEEKNFSFQQMVKFRPPEGAPMVVEAIRAVSKKGLPIELLAPMTLTVDLYKKNNAFFIHLLNHEPDRPERSILLKIQSSFKKVKSARLHSPDHPGKSVRLKAVAAGSCSEIIVPEIEVYGVVEVT